MERFSLENTTLLEGLLKFLFTNITSLFSINSYYRAVKQNFPVSRCFQRNNSPLSLFHQGNWLFFFFAFVFLFFKGSEG